MKTRAAVLYGTGQKLKVEELDLEPPRAGEVLIDMKAAGVCHSDYHVVTGDAPHAMPVDTIAPGGTAVMLGFPGSGSTFEIDPAKVIRDEKTLTGAIFGSAHTHRDFVKFGRLYLDGQLPIDQLITSTYPLEQVNRACTDMLAGDSGRGVLVFD